MKRIKRIKIVNTLWKLLIMMLGRYQEATPDYQKKVDYFFQKCVDRAMLGDSVAEFEAFVIDIACYKGQPLSSINTVFNNYLDNFDNPQEYVEQFAKDLNEALA